MLLGIQEFLKMMNRKINFADYDSVLVMNDIEHLFLAGGVTGFVPQKISSITPWEMFISSYENTHGSKELIDVYREAELEYAMISNKNILPINGGTSGLYAALSEAICNRGKKILVFTPCWSMYDKIITHLGGECIFIPFQQDDIDILIKKVENKANDMLGAILIASPMNPTGITVKNNIWKILLELSDKINTHLIVDETYFGLEYNEKNSILKVAKNINSITVIRSLSKYYCMPGLRVGFIIASSDLIKKYHNIARDMYLSVSNLSQKIASELIVKFKDLNWHKTYCLERLKRFEKLGDKYSYLKIIHPDSAFFVCFMLLDHNGNVISAQKLSEVTGIVARDCNDFKMNGFLRINLCCSEDIFDLFIKKMQLFLETMENKYNE